MKNKNATLLLALLCASTITRAHSLSHSVDFDAFNSSLFENLQVVDVVCPPEFPEAKCYVHGYDDFFDFEEHFSHTVAMELIEVERWSLKNIQIEGGQAEAFEATYRSASGEIFTLIYPRAGLGLVVSIQ
jgi:hypothetical protein